MSLRRADEIGGVPQYLRLGEYDVYIAHMEVCVVVARERYRNADL